MLVFAASGYGFVVLAGRTLPKGEATLANSLYFLVNVVGPGIFFAIEQIANREASAAGVTGTSLGAIARRSYTSGLKLLSVVAVGLVALAPVLGGKTLHGNWALYAEVVAMPVISLHLHLVRGMLAGTGRFGGYAGTLTIEGGARIVLCLALALGHASGAWAYGLVYVGGSAVAAVVGYAVLRRPVHGTVEAAAAAEPAAGPAGDHAAGRPEGALAPTGSGTSSAAGRGWVTLAAASLFAQLLPNLAPLIVNSRLPAASASALAFDQAAVVARIPLLLFLPIQTMLLPALTSAVARGDHGAVRVQLRKILVVTTGAGVAGAAVFTGLGAWALRVFFGQTTTPSTGVLGLLAVGTVVLMVATVAQPALVAVDEDIAIMTGWGLGALATGVIAVLPVAAISAAAAGQVAGPAITALILGLALWKALRHGPAGAPAEPAVSQPAGSLR